MPVAGGSIGTGSSTMGAGVPPGEEESGDSGTGRPRGAGSSPVGLGLPRVNVLVSEPAGLGGVAIEAAGDASGAEVGLITCAGAPLDTGGGVAVAAGVASASWCPTAREIGDAGAAVTAGRSS